MPRLVSRPAGCLVLVCAVVWVVGCGDAPPSGTGATSVTPGGAVNHGGAASSAAGGSDNGPGTSANGSATPATPEPAIPRVVLTEEHAKTCVVKQGDVMPAAELKNLAGEAVQAPPMGKLSVVLFWNEANRYSEPALVCVADAVEAHKEVQALAVHVGPAADKVRQIVDSVQPPYSVAVDEDRGYYRQAANDETIAPIRLFLLNGRGEILWFAIEFSNATRREFESALGAVLRTAAP